MVDKNEGLKEFTKGLQSSLFATRPTVEEAYKETFWALDDNPPHLQQYRFLLTQ